MNKLIIIISISNEKLTINKSMNLKESHVNLKFTIYIYIFIIKSSLQK